MGWMMAAAIKNLSKESNFQNMEHSTSLWRSSLGNDQGETNRGLCDGMAQVQWRGV